MEDMDTTGTVQTLPLYGRHEHNRYCPNSTAVWKTWTQQILPKYYHCVWKTWTLVQQLVLPKHYHCMEDMDTTGTAQTLPLNGRHGHNRYCPNTTTVWKTWTQPVLPKHYHCMEDMDTTGTAQILLLYPLRNLRHCLKRNIGSSENMKRSTLLSYPVFLLQSLAA